MAGKEIKEIIKNVDCYTSNRFSKNDKSKQIFYLHKFKSTNKF